MIKMCMAQSQLIISWQHVEVVDNNYLCIYWFRLMLYIGYLSVLFPGFNNIVLLNWCWYFDIFADILIWISIFGHTHLKFHVLRTASTEMLKCRLIYINACLWDYSFYTLGLVHYLFSYSQLFVYNFNDTILYCKNLSCLPFFFVTLVFCVFVFQSHNFYITKCLQLSVYNVIFHVHTFIFLMFIAVVFGIHFNSLMFINW